jgi:transcriptional regulator with XRE-family HTH domain
MHPRPHTAAAAPADRTGDAAAQPAARPTATGLDGPTLRAVRESIGVPLRRIARQAGMSHGHLSKVERGEHGRPVTPAIMAAYERVTGVRLTEAAAHVAERRDRDTGRRGKTWRPGQLTDMRRQAYNAAVGAIAIGGHLGEPVSRLIDSTGRPVTPTPPDEADIEQLEQLVTVLTALDLRHGGGLTSQITKALLRWAVAMLDTAGMPEPTRARLTAIIGVLAARAGWAAYDVAAHEAARSLFRLALSTATRAGDPNLRAHVLADVAAQHNHLGYHHDALAVIRLGEGDERVAPPVRMLLHTVKARTYAALAEADHTARQIDHAETIYADPGQSTDPADWTATLLHPGHLYAATGHAMATLAGHTGTQAHTQEARRRLAQAVDVFDPATHARTRTLAALRLATLQLVADDPEPGAHTVRVVLQTAAQIRSARITHSLTSLRTLAAHHPDQQTTQPLVSEITAVIGDGTTSPDAPDRAESSEPAPESTG